MQVHQLHCEGGARRLDVCSPPDRRPSSQPARLNCLSERLQATKAACLTTEKAAYCYHDFAIQQPGEGPEVLLCHPYVCITVAILIHTFRHALSRCHAAPHASPSFGTWQHNCTSCY